MRQRAPKAATWRRRANWKNNGGGSDEALATAKRINSRRRLSPANKMQHQKLHPRHTHRAAKRSAADIQSSNNTHSSGTPSTLRSERQFCITKRRIPINSLWCLTTDGGQRRFARSVFTGSRCVELTWCPHQSDGPQPFSPPLVWSLSSMASGREIARPFSSCGVVIKSDVKAPGPGKPAPSVIESIYNFSNTWYRPLKCNSARCIWTSVVIVH